jgi:hypothetical protein
LHGDSTRPRAPKNCCPSASASDPSARSSPGTAGRRLPSSAAAPIRASARASASGRARSQGLHLRGPSRSRTCQRAMSIGRLPTGRAAPPARARARTRAHADWSGLETCRGHTNPHEHVRRSGAWSPWHLLDASVRGSPDSGDGGVSRVVGEVLRLPTEGPLHAVRQVGVTPVEHLLEEVDEQLDPFARNALLV